MILQIELPARNDNGSSNEKEGENDEDEEKSQNEDASADFKYLSATEKFNKLDEEQKQIVINTLWEKYFDDPSQRQFVHHNHKPEFMPKDYVVPDGERVSTEDMSNNQ